jgi:formylglycine-generating enzyme required for sulfatase activity
MGLTAKHSKFVGFIFMVFLTTQCITLQHSKPLQPVPVIWIGGGSFVMGDTRNKENEDSLPLHKVDVTGFYLMAHEVTYRQFDRFATKAGFERPEDDGVGRGDRAVVEITWNEALAFCQAYGLRLPTEREWEYAAKEGDKQLLYSGANDIEELLEYARFQNNAAPYSGAVMSKKPNAFGLYDMTGNVFEWIGGYYPFYKEQADSVVWYPLGTLDMRVIRGGSYRELTSTLSNHWRVAVLGYTREDDIGFRCAGDRNALSNQAVILAG